MMQRADSTVFAFSVIMGSIAAATQIDVAARTAGASLAVASAVLLAYTRSAKYAAASTRNKIVGSYRLALPILTQQIVAGLIRVPRSLPPPTSAADWARFMLGRTSPAYAGFVALAAAVPGARGAALAAVTSLEYALLQPRSCTAILSGTRGLDAYFVQFAAAASAGAARVAALVGAPTAIDAAALPTPCPHSACVATMATLHALAIATVTLAVSPGVRCRRQAWVMLALGAHMVWSVLDATIVVRAPCPPLKLHPLVHQQDAALAGGSLASVLLHRFTGR